MCRIFGTTGKTKAITRADIIIYRYILKQKHKASAFLLTIYFRNAILNMRNQFYTFLTICVSFYLDKNARSYLTHFLLNIKLVSQLFKACVFGAA